ncbi:hypothetical protein OHB26_27375 [Nocardia sp. NBC_01503]|uniref:hypothetical protein n=1 Tax=Nocardia sp. NBC_01503 TaxID=2975997 RepID=UPI002E7B1FEE|nr:hypothetical protein [Nocardia sp. NBC_01503]WTL30632.1 hypothetical protein OHB26_27375 [Nocardia sp. NBC_01503]
MGAVVVLGEASKVEGYRLAGATVLVAEDPAAVLRAWADIGSDTALIIVTAAAARVLDTELAAGAPLTVVMPP